MLYEQQKMDESLAFYKKAMMLDPSDYDAKINYELMKRQMRKQEEQEQNQEKDQDPNKDDQMMITKTKNRAIKSQKINRSRKIILQRKKIKTRMILSNQDPLRGSRTRRKNLKRGLSKIKKPNLNTNLIGNSMQRQYLMR